MLCQTKMRHVQMTMIDSDDEGEAVDQGDECSDDYAFIVAAFGCDLAYVPLGTGLGRKVEVNGQDVTLMAPLKQSFYINLTKLDLEGTLRPYFLE